MIRIEAWTKNPEGTYDVTVVHSGRRHTYLLKTDTLFREFLNHITNKKYHSAFALLSPGEALPGAKSDPPADGQGRTTLSDGRMRPDPAEPSPPGEHPEAGGSPIETGLLFGRPDASLLIASADNRSVMLYPF